MPIRSAAHAAPCGWSLFASPLQGLHRLYVPGHIDSWIDFGKEGALGQVVRPLDRVLVVDFGRPVATGVPSEIQTHPDVIRAYLGEVQSS
jgi:hypothetical protein